MRCGIDNLPDYIQGVIAWNTEERRYVFYRTEKENHQQLLAALKSLEKDVREFDGAREKLKNTMLALNKH